MQKDQSKLHHEQAAGVHDNDVLIGIATLQLKDWLQLHDKPLCHGSYWSQSGANLVKIFETRWHITVFLTNPAKQQL